MTVSLNIREICVFSCAPVVNRKRCRQFEIFPARRRRQDEIIRKGNNLRVIHLTFYKCASQWVRDILTDSEVISVSGFPLSAGGIDVASEGWPNVPSDSFAGPLYGASYENWSENAADDDRAIVVLRDPRDLVISLVFSLGFSHVPSSMTRLLRSPISAASDRDRVRIGIFLLTQWADRMRSWGTAPPGNREYVTSYQRLTSHPKEEFGAICRFLG